MTEHRTPDDLHAATSTLQDTPGVVAVDVVDDVGEAVIAPDYNGVPSHVIHVLADHNVTITDVSPQGQPTHYILTIT